MTLASPVGIDLIVVGGAAKTEWRQILVDVHNGAFGVPAPPVILCTGQTGASDTPRIERGVVRTVVLAGPLRSSVLVQALDLAFEEPEASG